MFYKVISQWNPNVKQRYGMVDPDTTEITTMETTGTYIFSCDFQRGPSHEILSQ